MRRMLAIVVGLIVVVLATPVSAQRSTLAFDFERCTVNDLSLPQLLDKRSGEPSEEYSYSGRLKEAEEGIRFIVEALANSMPGLTEERLKSYGVSLTSDLSRPALGAWVGIELNIASDSIPFSGLTNPRLSSSTKLSYVIAKFGEPNQYEDSIINSVFEHKEGEANEIQITYNMCDSHFVQFKFDLASETLRAIAIGKIHPD